MFRHKKYLSVISLVLSTPFAHSMTLEEFLATHQEMKESIQPQARANRSQKVFIRPNILGLDVDTQREIGNQLVTWGRLIHKHGVRHVRNEDIRATKFNYAMFYMRSFCNMLENILELEEVRAKVSYQLGALYYRIKMHESKKQLDYHSDLPYRNEVVAKSARRYDVHRQSAWKYLKASLGKVGTKGPKFWLASMLQTGFIPEEYKAQYAVDPEETRQELMDLATQYLAISASPARSQPRNIVRQHRQDINDVAPHELGVLAATSRMMTKMARRLRINQDALRFSSATSSSAVTPETEESEVATASTADRRIETTTTTTTVLAPPSTSQLDIRQAMPHSCTTTVTISPVSTAITTPVDPEEMNLLQIHRHFGLGLRASPQKRKPGNEELSRRIRKRSRLLNETPSDDD